MKAAAILATAAVFPLVSARPGGGAERLAAVDTSLSDRLSYDLWQTRIERGRAQYERFAAGAVQRYLSFPPNRSREARNLNAQVTSILEDPTLRVGDIYVSSGGFLVFRGRLGFMHQTSDFTRMPAKQARELSLSVSAE